MTVYSKHPILTDDVRTFQTFRWADMPGARLPADPEDADSDGNTGDWFSAEERKAVRLSSKSHWDVPIEIDGQVVHFLVSHPTPPTFDGPEDRNGLRNADEIRFWADYVSGADYIYDDTGEAGGLEQGAHFVIAGDQNADPNEGDSVPGAAEQLLDHLLVDASLTPASKGGVAAAGRQGGANLAHTGDPAFDTADFNDGAPGNLRVDYLLPSTTLGITDSGVFWVPATDPLFPLTGDSLFNVSDHRALYLDVEVPAVPVPAGLPLLLSGLGVVALLRRRR